MPFESERQRRFLWANHPEIAREFANKEKPKPKTKPKAKPKSTPKPSYPK